MSDVIDHIIESISPASVAQATGATRRLMQAELGTEHGSLSELATRLCAARHSPHPKLSDKTVVVVAADHGVSSPGIDLGANNPSAVGLELMAKGGAAINSAARSANVELVLVDAGITGGEDLDLGRSVLSFRAGNGTQDFTSAPAMSMQEAEAAVQTGVALAFSLADAGLDLLALGQMSAGSQPCSAALVAALTGDAPADLSPSDADVVDKALRVHKLGGCTPMEILSLIGGFDIGVMTGLILAAASIHVPIVLDGHGTSAAALLASRLAPEVRGYLFASHRGGIKAHSRALEALNLQPLFAVGLAQGEGTGAVLAIPMLEAAARVLSEAGNPELG